MIKFVIFLLFTTHLFLINAQEFTSVRIDVQSFYERDDTLYTVAFDEKKELANGDSVGYFPANWSHKSDPICSYDSSSYYFLGEKIIARSGNKQWLFNKYGDTLSFEFDVFAPKGTTFTLMENDTQTFEVVYKEQVFLPSYKILDTLQNVLVYEIVVRDSLGNLINHSFQGQEFEVAQYFGFNITYNWWAFPEDTMPYYLAGISPFQDISGTKGLSYNTILKIKPGFERHYKEEVFQADTLSEIKLFKLFAIDLQHNGDSTIITNRRTMWKIDPTDSDTTYSIDTMVEKFAKSDYLFLDKLHSQPGKYYSEKHNDTLYAVVRNHRWQQDTNSFIETVSRGYKYDVQNNCLSEYQQEDSLVFGENVGFVYHKSGYSGNYLEKQLLYYKKGVQKWGEPIDFSGITGLDVPMDIAFSVYPNPFSNRLYIEYGDLQDVQIMVFDMLGRRIYEGAIPDAGSINTSEWSNGVFLIKVSTPEGQGWQKLIKGGH